MQITIEYYALLREKAGRSTETISTQAGSPDELWQELQDRYRFPLEKQSIRVAIDDEFAAWDSPLAAGCRVVFLPPVSGG